MGPSSQNSMCFPKKLPIRGYMYLPHTDSSAWFWFCLKSSCLYAPSHPYPPLPSHPPTISSRCSFSDHLKVFSCLLSGHAVHCVLIWLSYKESPTGIIDIIDTFLSYRYRYIYTWQWHLEEKSWWLNQNWNELQVLMGVKFYYPFPENLQHCDGYSHKQKFSLINITGKVLRWAITLMSWAGTCVYHEYISYFLQISFK